MISIVFALMLSFSATSASAQPLPPPDTKHDVKNFSDVIGWPAGKMPVAPQGFEVARYAEGFRNPRWMYQAPNGDVFVSEAETEPKFLKKIGAVIIGANKSNNTGKSADRITLLRDANGDGVPEVRETFLESLNQPFGMVIVGKYFYVANTDSIRRYLYKDGQTKITTKGEKILDLPAGGYNNHWTRNLLASQDGKHIYVSVGSGSNHAEHGLKNEVRRANILEITPDGKNERIFAAGLRNPVGMDWAPGSGQLWTAVNERDNLGDDLVPDYITSVKDGGFYGWPYSYYGQNVDSRVKEKRPDLVAKAIVPDVQVGPHTASLGLAFYKAQAFPQKYRGGAFIGQHGSWNRKPISGYKVAFVPFADGKPSGPMEDFLTGFIADEQKATVHGRPVGITMLKDGSMLVADDASNVIWRVTAQPDSKAQ